MLYILLDMTNGNVLYILQGVYHTNNYTYYNNNTHGTLSPILLFQ